MLKKVIEKVFGSRHQRDAKKLVPLVAQVHAHEERIKSLTDEELQGQTARFRAILAERTGEAKTALEAVREEKHGCADPVERQRLEDQFHRQEAEYKKAVGAVLDDILPEAFATVREACRRLMGTTVMVTGHEMVWEMVPYDVQLMGGVALHRGTIAEMATGEGKTLVATLPMYLNALAGRGAHLVTVNNYLARRDSQWMGHLYKYLGLTVGCLDDTEPQTPERRAAYLCDITYGTNNEFGFDYLRDNMVYGLDQRVQRDHAYAIVDEVDSILIDEARTPLIISGPVGNEGEDKYSEHNARVADLVRKQTAVVNQLIAEGEQLWENEKTRKEAAYKLYQARLGMPKNKRLLKMLNETGVKQAVQQAELRHLADRKLPTRQQEMRGIEEVLYFVLDEKGHSVHLTDEGAAALSPDDPHFFIVEDISIEIHQIETDPDLSPAEQRERRQQVELDYATKSEKLHIIHKLLQAHSLYEKDVEYIIQDNQVLIVDEYTGRVLAGRRWSDGLHQAVEAKEGVQIKGETQTLATVTIQNYFRMYDKLAGMTGTAETEESEFYSIYGLEVLVVPTNKPIRRADHPDRIYKSRREKYNAVVDEIARVYEAGLPVLIGTTTVDVSETLSKMLKRRGLKHEVLNAKYHQREAEIVEQAGRMGSITIATNMAGRGTDIKLDKRLDLTQTESGLQIIGTERHESRRIDRQLRGRAGRQGDPGASLFFLSLEDDLMRLFMADRVARYMDKAGAEEGEVITGKLVTAAIESAQKRVELQNFQQRKRLLEYDDVMNQQREVIYSLRLFALDKGEELKAEARRMIAAALRDAVGKFLEGAGDHESWDREGLKQQLTMQFLVTVEAVLNPKLDTVEKVAAAAMEEGDAAFMRKVDYLHTFGEGLGVGNVDQQVLAQVMLGVIDEKWKDHLYDLDQLRNAIQYRAYGQKDPLVEYKKEAFEMFEDLMRDLQATFADRYLKVQVSADPPAPQRRMPAPAPQPSAPPPDSTDDLFAAPARTASGPVAPPPTVRSNLGTVGATQGANVPVVGRNDPCPCGSGKKYKKCHGAGR